MDSKGTCVDLSAVHILMHWSETRQKHHIDWLTSLELTSFSRPPRQLRNIRLPKNHSLSLNWRRMSLTLWSSSSTLLCGMSRFPSTIRCCVCVHMQETRRCLLHLLDVFILIKVHHVGLEEKPQKENCTLMIMSLCHPLAQLCSLNSSPINRSQPPSVEHFPCPHQASIWLPIGLTTTKGIFAG